MSKSLSMKSMPVGLFAILLTIDVLVLVLEKYATGVAGSAVGNEIAFYLHLLQMPATWLVIVLAPIQLWVWTKILTKSDLSVAYPISSLCFPLTMIASQIVFHEKVSPVAWIGGVLIAAGIAIVGGDHSDDAQAGPAESQNPSAVNQNEVIEEVLQ